MSKYVKRGTSIILDSVKEKEIIEQIESMADTRSLSHLVSHLVRLAFESPEVYGDGNEVRRLLLKMQEYGMTPTRYNYFKEIANEVAKIKSKVDSIYDLAYKTYILAQMGKRLGLEEKADANLRATFIAERQICNLCETLGIPELNYVYASNKLEDTHKKAEDVLEYILETYDGIIQELKLSMKPIEIQALSKSAIDENNVSNGSVSSNNPKTEQASDKQENKAKADMKPIESGHSQIANVADVPIETIECWLEADESSD